MTTHLLKRASDRPAPQLSLATDISLRLARLHEVCGPGRRSFAMWLAQKTEGPIFWVSPKWLPDKLNPRGIAHFADPARFILLTPTRDEDVLWTLETALRAGQVPLVIGELTGYPALTPVRRMHLAAEEGAKINGSAPLGVILTPDNGGAPGVETRWHMAPSFHEQATTWHLKRLRARTASPKSWDIAMGENGFFPIEGTARTTA